MLQETFALQFFVVFYILRIERVLFVHRLESLPQDIVNLCDDSKCDEVFNDVIHGASSGNLDHINELSEECSKKFHESYQKWEHKAPSLELIIVVNRILHQVDGFGNLWHDNNMEKSCCY